MIDRSPAAPGCPTRLLLLLALLAAVGPAPSVAQDGLEVVARMSPEVIGIDQVVRFTIEVQGSGIGSRRFEPQFELDNLEIDAGPSTSQSFSLRNGVASRSESLSWILRPLAVGPAAAREIQLQIGDQLFELPDAELTVQKEAVGRAPDPRRRALDPFEEFFPPLSGRLRRGASPRPEVFLRAEVEPRDPWIGQQTLYTLYLYTQAHISSINPERLPDFNGFWVRELEMPEPAEVEMVDVDGRRFGRVPILRRALFPLRPGRLDLEPAKVQLSVRMPDRTFGSMFSGIDQIRRDSNALTVVARPLPDGAPEGFEGAVGDLELRAAVEPAEVEVGEAATFSVTLSGVGHIQGLPAPQVDDVEGLRVFPPQQDSDERVVGTGVRGSRTWSFVLVPEAVGSYRLPALRIPYFDPSEGAFRTAETPVVELRAAGAAAPPERRPADELPPATVDEPEPVARWRPDPRFLPWLLVAVLLGLLAFMVVRQRGATAAASGRGELEAALREAEREPNARRAAARMEQGWRRFLEERWDIPPGVASTQWGRQLQEAGAPDQAAAELVGLADDLHYLRYAPQLADTDSLARELILRSQKLGRSLK